MQGKFRRAVTGVWYLVVDGESRRPAMGYEVELWQALTPEQRLKLGRMEGGRAGARRSQGRAEREADDETKETA